MHLMKLAVTTLWPEWGKLFTGYTGSLELLLWPCGKSEAICIRGEGGHNMLRERNVKCISRQAVCGKKLIIAVGSYF